MTTTPPAMRHSSWYLPRPVAERLAALVDDLHFRTRRPKNEVLGAVVTVALEHQDDIAERLTAKDGAA